MPVSLGAIFDSKAILGLGIRTLLIRSQYRLTPWEAVADLPLGQESVLGHLFRGQTFLFSETHKYFELSN